jgi:hypothetical protein
VSTLFTSCLSKIKAGWWYRSQPILPLWFSVWGWCMLRVLPYCFMIHVAILARWTVLL